MRYIALALVFWAASANASISLSQTFVDFYNTPVGSYGPTQYVYVYSHDNDQMFLNVSDTCYNDVRVTNFCHTLQPYGSCQIQIQFSPRQEGTVTCNVNINASNGGGFATIYVRGEGVRR